MATFTPKIVRNVTLPVLKLVKNQPRYVAILGRMHVGKKLDDQKEAATLVRAMDLETSELGLVICPTVMQKELDENYPGHAYVGRCFSVTLTRIPEKRYNLISLNEIELPEGITLPALDTSDDNASAASSAASTAPASTAKPKK